ncbi:hypothetical protein P0D88_16775 [Paraburkholderia sp. RL18-103-BIB-C]|uniref:glycine-rich domain-containing protein n=1 Tax=Paraburkholderia sp. RL18-103-BIB-C TaxID=3031637 RepID=UPI0038B7FAB7
MFQTDQPTAVSSLPTPATPSTQGFFTNGNPAVGIPATVLEADFMNMVMMELVNVVTAGGLTPSKTTYTQVRDAIKRIGQNTIVLADTGAVNAYTAVNATPLVSGTWVDGVVQAVKIAHSNTGASTYAPDGLAAIPIYGLGLQPLQGGELALNGTAVLMHATIAGVNSGNPIAVLMECAGGAQQIAPATQSNHAAQLGQIGSMRGELSFATAGTFSFTVPAAIYAVFARVWAGGGGGGGANQAGAAAGGGAGGYAEGWVSVTPGQVISVVVGAAGAAGSNTPTTGGAGGSSSFGASVSATGGGGGQLNVGGISSVPGTAGTGSGGNMAVNGEGGGQGYQSTTGYVGGQGGAAFAGSSPAPNVGAGGTPASTIGGGGNGASANFFGGPGGVGRVTINW